MNQTTKIIIGAVVLAVLAFWAGTVYANHKNANTKMSGMAGMNGQFAGRGGFGGGMGGTRNAANFVAGTVLSKTDTTITVQNQAGGSKILLIAPSTTVSKSAVGSIADVTVGSSVVATGTTNSDGSITAQNLQLRPQK